MKTNEKHLVAIIFLPIFAMWGSIRRSSDIVDHGQLTGHCAQVKRFVDHFVFRYSFSTGHAFVFARISSPLNPFWRRCRPVIAPT